MSDDPCNDAVVRNMEKLIKCILGDSLTASERRTQEQHAIHKIRHHRYMSTNGHGVRRSVNNMMERFYYEGMDEMASAICLLCNTIIEHGAWRSHYEVDVQYSMLDFLVSSTYEPVQNVRRNLTGMEQRVQAICDAIEMQSMLAKSSQIVPPLSLNNYIKYKEELAHNYTHSLESDDSLSEWSDGANNADESNVPDTELTSRSSLQNLALVRTTALKRVGSHDLSSCGTESVRYHRWNDPSESDSYSMSEFSNSRNSIWSGQTELAALEPPEPQTQYTRAYFEHNHLYRLIHSNWWQEDLLICENLCNNEPTANFAIANIQHLNRQSRSVTKHNIPRTTCESTLVREIIFMFFAPVRCGFFDVQTSQQKISVRKNISISSVSTPTLYQLLVDEVLPPMQAMLDLRHIINELTLPTGDELTTGTQKCFGWGLHELLKPVKERLIDFERRLLDKANRYDVDNDEDDPDADANVDDDDVEHSTTLIAFLLFMKKEFKHLLLLKSLANCAIVRGPAFLRSAYLLSQIYKHTMLNGFHETSVTGLLLVSMRRYCCIMDNWWQHARFDDWQNEYIVECVPESVAYFGLRMRARCPLVDSSADGGDGSSEQQEIMQELRNCPFYRLLLDHAMETGESQDILASVHLLGDLVLSCKDVSCLHTNLTNELYAELNRQKINTSSMIAKRDDLAITAYNLEVLEIASSLGNQDLMDIFTMHLRDFPVKQLEEQQQQQPCQQKLAVPSCQLIELLDKPKDSLKLQQTHLLPRLLVKLLRHRYEIANIHVMRWYHEELRITDHIRFLRHIMLLEADYLMYPFYTNLFQQIEGYEDWASISLLSLELYDLLEPHYGSLANQLEVHLISKLCSRSNKIYEALDAIKLTYDMPAPLQSIITDSQMTQYNGIWRIVLKVKWAAWKLENMRFLRRKKRHVYAPLDLIGLTLRRLEILRFWLISLINSFHSHLCTHVMQSLGTQFDQQLHTTQNIQEFRNMHAKYMETLCKHCLLTPDFEGLLNAMEQIFHLIFVLDMEWSSYPGFFNESNALSIDMSSDMSKSDQSHNDKAFEFLALSQIDDIEYTYIRCHRMLANTLSQLVYKMDHKFLSSLEVAVNASIPH